MKTGICAIAHNAIALDYHLEEFVKWHSPLVDELFISVSSESTDETIPVLRYLQKQYRNLIIEVTDWGSSKNSHWLGNAKLYTFKKLNANLKLLLDIDEFFLDSDFITLSRLDPDKVYAGEYLHFVGSYKTIATSQWWPFCQWRLAYSIDQAAYNHIFTDPSGSNLVGIEPDQIPKFRIYHFGAVRKRQLLLGKWEKQMQRNYAIASKATDSWLTCAEGTLEKITTIEDLWLKRQIELPKFFQTPEFVRDSFEIYNSCK